MSEGILVFSSRSSLIPSATRSKKLAYHTYLLLIMLAIIFVGQTVIYLVKESKGKAHFTTWHGLFGLITVIHTTTQVLAGLFVKYASWFKLPKSIKLVDLKLYHGASGCVAFLLSCATLLLGLSSTWFTSLVHEYIRGICMVAVLVLGLAIFNDAYELVTVRLLPRLIKK